MEAMRVPRPPRFTPMSRGRASSVKPERSRAAGTLLITWLARTETSSTWPDRAEVRKFWKAGTLPRLPMNTKKARKVSSRE